MKKAKIFLSGLLIGLLVTATMAVFANPNREIVHVNILEQTRLSFNGETLPLSTPIILAYTEAAPNVAIPYVPLHDVMRAMGYGVRADVENDFFRINGQTPWADTLSFPAGFFTAGEDFPIGRYRIVGTTSNFTIHNVAGRLRVNVVFGERASHVQEYIYNFARNDEIHARAPFRLVPID